MAPLDLIAMAKAASLQGLSITDHDTLQAYPIAIPAAKEAGIRLGAGIELSCQFQGKSLHLLGYDFLLDHPAIAALCAKHITRRKNRNLAMLEKLKAQGMPISEEELAQKALTKVAGRVHIALVMVDKGYVKTVREAFSRFLGDGEKCYVPGQAFDPSETIAVLHEAQGKAFIAHPHLLPEEMNVEELLELPFDGLECYYCHLPEKRWLAIAKRRGLLVSGGSDFHGKIRPEVELGCNGVGIATFQQIFTHEL